MEMNNNFYKKNAKIKPYFKWVCYLLLAKNIPVIGRDKSGDHSRNAEVKIILPQTDEYRVLHLKPDSHVAKLIARIDDEAHRFAITYHSLLKRKKMLK